MAGLDCAYGTGTVPPFREKGGGLWTVLELIML